LSWSCVPNDPEKLVTLGTKDQKKQEWTIQRNL
jgi:hypothetical protein